MNLEREVEKETDKNGWVYAGTIIGILGLTTYLCIQIGQYILEKIGPNLPTPNQYIPPL